MNTQIIVFGTLILDAFLFLLYCTDWCKRPFLLPSRAWLPVWFTAIMVAALGSTYQMVLVGAVSVLAAIQLVRTLNRLEATSMPCGRIEVLLHLVVLTICFFSILLSLLLLLVWNTMGSVKPIAVVNAFEMVGVAMAFTGVLVLIVIPIIVILKRSEKKPKWQVRANDVVIL